MSTTNQILIVDDEPANLATLKQILADNYPLVFARNGADCLTAAKKHMPALILLDIQMPDMDGYTVCRALKSDPVTENIPVIFVSSLGEVGDEAAGFDCGGVDYIIKPVSSALVRARVRTHLSLVHATTLERYVKQLELEQAKTARLSRIHSVLSGINSAVFRIQEPNSLFAEACHIASDKGGFGIAWIGVANSNLKRLSVAASHGIESDSINGLLLTTEHEATESNILSKALNSGEVIYCNDVQPASDDDDSVYLDVKNRGYRSVIALPLMVSEKIIGIMVLYAREVNFFDDEELKLLSELAGDISFALQAIDNKKRANFLSYYDVLTELPNTPLFLDRLTQLMQNATRDNSRVFVIAINLNQFKQLNDRFGRHIGDRVLRTIAKRLNRGLPCACSVTRIGADNFALIGEQKNADAISDCYTEIINLLTIPIVVEKIRLEVKARMGIAVFPGDADDSESLLKNAEIALRQTKILNAPCMYYSPEINARIAEKFELETMLKEALNKDQFTLHFQPKIDLLTGKIVGAEALIRWLHPERGLISPIDFIPLAEETGLITPIGKWVIRTVCQQQSAWLSAGLPIVPVALNLSAVQFKESDIYQTVRNALDEYKLDPRWLELEVTETMVMQKPEEAERTLRAFRELGLHLALDDFGTGYSSLAYLKRFPFNTVKIDRAFVTDIVENPEDAAIASAIIGMAHSLRMLVVAEGVETLEQLEFLREQHCDQMQGYFFSPPIPATEFCTMLTDEKNLNLTVT